MGSDGSTITVTCDCGREMRVSRRLMGVSVKCVVCGADIQLPGNPDSGGGPDCPHCGRPWPVGEARCPSCLARTRKRAPRREESDEGGGVFSRRFSESPAGPDYEPPPPVQPATVRVKHWYEKPTTRGWSIASALVGAAALWMVTRGTGAATGGLWWYAGSAVVGLVAVGLLRGNSSARTFLLWAPMLGGMVGAGLMAWLTPGAMMFADILISLGAVAVAVVGLAMLTAQHGQVAVVGFGGVLTGVGLIALAITLADAGPTEAEMAAMARQAQAKLAGASEILTTSRPAPDKKAAVVTAGDSVDSDDSDEPDAMDDSSEVLITGAPLGLPMSPVAEPVASQPTTQPASQLATQPATPWLEVMASQGFSVQFPNADAVELHERTVAPDGRDRQETAYAMTAEDLYCQAVVYEDVIPADQDAEYSEYGRLARLMAESLPGEIEYQIWRRGRGPRVYFILKKHTVAGMEWHTRIEARRFGARVLVMVGSHNRHTPKAAAGAKAFFESLELPE